MALYIRNQEADRLAEAYRAAGGYATKTEAVIAALRRQLALAGDQASENAHLAPILEEARAFAPDHPDFDFKSFSDDLNDGL